MASSDKIVNSRILKPLSSTLSKPLPHFSASWRTSLLTRVQWNPIHGMTVFAYNKEVWTLNKCIFLFPTNTNTVGPPSVWWQEWPVASVHWWRYCSMQGLCTTFTRGTVSEKNNWLHPNWHQWSLWLWRNIRMNPEPETCSSALTKDIC